MYWSTACDLEIGLNYSLLHVMVVQDYYDTTTKSCLAQRLATTIFFVLFLGHYFDFFSYLFVYSGPYVILQADMFRE